MNPPIGQVLRSAVSSTELLYERAMARFYQAVEIEESMKDERKRSFSVDQELIRRRLSANFEGQEPNFAKLTVLTESERRSSLKRRLSGESPNVLLTIPRLISQNNEKDIIEENVEKVVPVTNNNNKNIEIAVKKPVIVNLPKIEDEDKDEYSSDYTDSTEDSLNEREKFFTALTHKIENESDTYHPTNMEPRVLSPYRPPEDGNAVEVLTRPLPSVVDPNFVPKPILKKRSIEFTSVSPTPTSEEYFSDENSKKKAPDKPKRNSLIKTDQETIIATLLPEPLSPLLREDTKREPSPLFEKEITPEIIITEIESKPEEIDLPIESPPDEVKPKYISPENIMKKKKLAENRQSSIEENKAIADFYGDIIREVGVGGKYKKPKVPIYMNPEALKKLNKDNGEEKVSKEEPTPVVQPPQPKQLYKRPSLPANIEIKRQDRSKKIQKSNTLPDDEDEVQVNISEIKQFSADNMTNPLIPSRFVRQRSKEPLNRSQSKSPVSHEIGNSHLSVSDKSASPKLSPSTTPLSSRSISPVELEQQEEEKMQTNVKFITDFFLFMVASWLYFFKHPLLALPLLIIIGYRQLKGNKD